MARLGELVAAAIKTVRLRRWRERWCDMRDVIKRFSVVNARLIRRWKHVKFESNELTTEWICHAMCGGCGIRQPRGDNGGKHDGFKSSSILDVKR